MQPSTAKKVLLALTLSSSISSAQAQTVATCDSTSPQCCWVVRIRQLMGQPTSIDPTSPTACCNGLARCSGSVITTINWMGHGLSGTIPSDIENLVNLTYLDFSHNALTGSIPPAIGNLQRLTYLCLEVNRLTGSIPPEIGNLTSITELYLANNQLTGSIPREIGNLSKLRELRMSRNRLSGPIPPEIGNLTQVMTILIIDNKLNGSIPSEIGNLRNLRYFSISNNTLTGSIPSTIGNCLSLETLSFERNQLSGTIPLSLWNITNLITLHLSMNQLSGEIPPEIGNMKNLDILYMYRNGLNGSIPAEIGNLTRLSDIKLYENQFSGSIPAEFGKLTRVNRLLLHRNQLSGPIPPSIVNMTSLYDFQIQENTGLSGAFSPLCSTRVYAMRTGVTLCGCSSSRSPAFLFPDPSTPSACLSTGPATPLAKRTLVYSENIGTLRFTCYKDINNNPFQDCLNTMAAVCSPNYMGTNATLITNCKFAIDTMTAGLNTFWQKVRRECGQWAWNGFIGSYMSGSCATANTALQANGYYNLPDRTRVFVTSQLTNSVSVALWANSVLAG